MNITVEELIELINKLPDSDKHIYVSDGKYHITNEWLVGSFAGRGFEADTLEEAAYKMNDYLLGHVGHDSIVGIIVDRSGFPDIEKLEKYFARIEVERQQETEE